MKLFCLEQLPPVLLNYGKDDNMLQVLLLENSDHNKVGEHDEVNLFLFL